MSKEYDNQIQKVIKSRNNSKDIIYTPLGHSDELKSRGKIVIRENSEILGGYIIQLDKNGNFNSQRIIGKPYSSGHRKDLIEFIIGLNGEIAKTLDYPLLSVEESDQNLIEIYQNKGYVFDMNGVGIKKL